MCTWESWSGSGRALTLGVQISLSTNNKLPSPLVSSAVNVIIFYQIFVRIRDNIGSMVSTMLVWCPNAFKKHYCNHWSYFVLIFVYLTLIPVFFRSTFTVAVVNYFSRLKNILFYLVTTWFCQQQPTATHLYYNHFVLLGTF